MPTNPISGLTADTASCTLAATSRELGLDITGARLVRLGENAIYELPAEGLVVRIARSVQLAARVRREVDVARWLAAQDFPAARIAGSVDQPYQVGGRLVTFWELVPPSDREPTVDDLAVILRDLHRLPDPPFELPEFDPFSVVPMRLADAAGVDPEAVEFLTHRYEELHASYSTLDIPTPPGLIHGDAHRGNLLIADGRPILLDFEVVAHGPREWDLVPTAVAVDRFGMPTATYASFAAIYGRDVTKWAGFPVLRGIRELTMTTWLMQIISEGHGHAAEFTRRVDSMRRGDDERRWHPF